MNEDQLTKEIEKFRVALMTFAASDAIHSAESRALLRTIEALAQSSGVDHIQNLPISQWYGQQQVKELEEVLISLENKNPAAAAHIQQTIDQAKRIAGLS